MTIAMAAKSWLSVEMLGMIVWGGIGWIVRMNLEPQSPTGQPANGLKTLTYSGKRSYPGFGIEGEWHHIVRSFAGFQFNCKSG
jgi:hypothetical protein